MAWVAATAIRWAAEGAGRSIELKFKQLAIAPSVVAVLVSGPMKALSDDTIFGATHF